MKLQSPLDFNGSPAEWNPKVSAVFQSGEPIEDYATVGLCSWCNQSLTSALLKAGYGVSHGICSTCKTNTLKQSGLYLSKSLTSACKN